MFKKLLIVISCLGFMACGTEAFKEIPNITSTGDYVFVVQHEGHDYLLISSGRNYTGAVSGVAHSESCPNIKHNKVTP